MTQLRTQKQLMNKKGMIGDAFDILFLVIMGVFCIVGYSFFLYSSTHTAELAVNERVAQSQVEDLFNTFLQSTVEYRGQKITIVELANSNFAEDKDLKLQLLKDQANEIFGSTILYTHDRNEYATQTEIKKWQGYQPWLVTIYKNDEFIGGVTTFTNPTYEPGDDEPQLVYSCNPKSPTNFELKLNQDGSDKLVFCVLKEGLKLLNDNH